MSKVDVKEVTSPQHWRDFCRVPEIIYKENIYWIPKPPQLEKQLLNQKTNPFFKHALQLPLLAYTDNQLVGRVCGFIDKDFSDDDGKTPGTYGFLEYLPQPGVLAALLKPLEAWFQQNKRESYLGPLNPSLHGEVGLLSEGHENSPYPLMTYSPKHYISDLEEHGHHQYKLFFAYHYQDTQQFPTAVFTRQKQIIENYGVKVRSINMSRLRQEMLQIKAIANEAMGNHWGYTPLSTADTDFLVDQIKHIIDPNLFLVAEKDDSIIGFLFGIPNINQFLGRSSSTKKISWFRLLKLMAVMKTPLRSRYISDCRQATLGIKKEFDYIAVGPALYCEMMNRCRKHGYKTAEASWVLADNQRVNRMHLRLGAKKSKEYVVLKKELNMP